MIKQTPKLDYKFLIIAILVVFSLTACMPKPVVREMPATYQRAPAIFEEAEQHFKNNRYQEAAQLFNTLINEFPEAPETPVALMKNGIIHKELGKFPEARSFFQTLIAKHPSNPLVEDAKIEILDTYLSEKNYQEVLSLAPRLFKRPVSKPYPLQLYIVVGNAHLGAGQPENAVKLYNMAFRIASSSEKDMVLEKLKTGIRQIPSSSLESLVLQLEDTFPKGYLMYQLGLNRIEDENYSEAVAVFNDFIQRFPGHPQSMQAEKLIDAIKIQSEIEDYAIGCLLPLSGKYTHLGQMAWTGIELAVSQFRSKYQKPSVRVVLRDTGSDNYRHSDAIADMTAENVTAIIGPMVNAAEAAREAQIQEIPLITLTLAGKITEHGDYVFRNFLTPEIQSKSLVSFMINSLGIGQFAVLYPGENYGTRYMNTFSDEVAAQGGIVLDTQPYDSTMTDFRVPLEKLRKHIRAVPDITPEEYLEKILEHKAYSQDFPFFSATYPSETKFIAIFIPDIPGKAAMILPQMVYHGFSGVYVLGTNLWHSEKFITMLDGYTHNVILTDGFFTKSENPLVRSFVEKFEMTYGYKPGFVEAVAYDTATLLLEIFTLKNIRNPSQLKDTLLQVVDFPGITGKTSFGPTGDAQKKAHVLGIINKQFRELKQP
jgi:ABC-type branched-subunit amino acid transport system substrate-binding protein/Tfp pilus assembly protein PilF